MSGNENESPVIDPEDVDEEWEHCFRVLNVREMADELGVTQACVRSRIRRRTIAFGRLGDRGRIVFKLQGNKVLDFRDDDEEQLLEEVEK